MLFRPRLVINCLSKQKRKPLCLLIFPTALDSNHVKSLIGRKEATCVPPLRTVWMKYDQMPIQGLAASMGSFILVGGERTSIRVWKFFRSLSGWRRVPCYLNTSSTHSPSPPRKSRTFTSWLKKSSRDLIYDRPIKGIPDKMVCTYFIRVPCGVWGC